MPLKKYIPIKAFFFIFIILFSAQSSLAGSSSPPAVKVRVDTQEISFDVPPVIQNGRTLVPLRGVAEALGALVAWEEKSKTVTIEKDDTTVELTVGNTVALKNKEKLTLDVPAKIIQGRTMIPLRFISEALGAVVQWEPASRLVSIQRPAEKENISRQLVVQGDLVNIRSGPGTNHEILTQVSRGTRLASLDKFADWYKVGLTDGQTGWIVDKYTKEEPATSTISPQTTEKPDPVVSSPDNQENKQTDPGKQIDPDEDKTNQEGALPVNGQNKDNSETGSPVALPGQGNGKQTLQLAVSQEENITKVKITSDQKITYNIFRLHTPERLVVDIDGTPPENLPAKQSIDSKAVSQLRIGWFSRDPDITRVVFDTEEEVLYKTETSADQKTITVSVFIPDIKDILPDTLIVLDAGHGGSDPGAIGGALGLKEKNVTLDVVKRIARLLTSYGARVILTRSADEYVTLDDRVRIANSAGADLFVSIHMNANNSNLLKGTSTYYVRSCNDSKRLGKSRQLAGCIQNALLTTLQLQDKNVRQADFVVIRDTTMPAVLAEVAYISNPEEEKLMTTEQFLENAAMGIVKGISSYLASEQ